VAVSKLIVLIIYESKGNGKSRIPTANQEKTYRCASMPYSNVSLAIPVMMGVVISNKIIAI